jgi:hypothetical protein
MIAALRLLAGSPAQAGDAATVLTFDDLQPEPPPGNGWVRISNGYGGLQWDNFGVLDGSVQQATSAYRIGMVSPRNVAFNLSGNPASVSRSTGFTLHSAYVTGPFAVVHLRVQGLVGTAVTYDNTYTISNPAPALISFNYVGVDRVIFVTSPDSPFALDNLTVTVPPPEAGCTFVISPHSGWHDFGAGTGMVSVTTQAGCAWSVVNTNDWVRILSGLNNTGNGTVTYAVAAEPTTTARSAFINIAGQDFMVSQSERPPVDPDLLTFDELLPYPFPMQNGYGGLNWDNFGVLDGSVQRATLGYRTGMVSPDNVAFNLSGNAASISSDVPFTLKSAYLTEQVANRMQLRVSGWVGTTLAYDNTYALNPTGPILAEFNYVGVDRVTFTPSPGSIFVMDNLRVSVPLDSDGDGVLDPDDACPSTAPGAVVDSHGCSIEQLAPCDGPAKGGTWKNHGQYVATVTKVAQSFRRAKLITTREMADIVRAAAKSKCGKKR